jgi:hypothetical protein
VIAVPSIEFIFDFFYGCAGKMRKLDDHKSSASFSILPQAEDLNKIFRKVCPLDSLILLVVKQLRN